MEFILLFQADTQERAEKGKPQQYFYELDPETWTIYLTVKTKFGEHEDGDDDVKFEADTSDEEEKDDEEPKFDESKIEITVLDDEEEENRVVYMRRMKGNWVVREMANLRSDAKIAELVKDDD